MVTASPINPGSLKIGTMLYHPFSMDVTYHKIIAITEYEDHKIYHARAEANVGACGRVEVSLFLDKKGALRFIELDTSHEYDDGLQDFVEGQYYTNKNEAMLVFYDIQKTLVWNSMNEKERLYKEAKDKYDRVVKLIETTKKHILEEQDGKDTDG